MSPRRGTPDQRPENDALERALRGLAVPAPDDDFQRRLRARLLADVSFRAGGRTPPAGRRAWHTPRWLPRAVAAGTAGVVGVAGLGVATSRALPGQPLYGAKRQIETWQLAATSGHVARGREQLAFARTRLAEVRALSYRRDLAAGPGTIAGGASDRITPTLRRMDSETKAGTSELVTAARAGDGRAAHELLTFAAGQSARLLALLPQLPATAAPAIDASRTMLRQVTAMATSLNGVRTSVSSTPQTAPRTGSGAASAPRPTRRSPAPPASPTPPAPAGPEIPAVTAQPPSAVPPSIVPSPAASTSTAAPSSSAARPTWGGEGGPLDGSRAGTGAVLSQRADDPAGGGPAGARMSG